MKPEISILTPAWNGESFLTECVESVLSQSFQNWELLISDDGSTDGSRELLAKFSDPRIRVWEQPSQLGIFGNLNFLARQARGDISFLLCQDDYFLEGGLEHVMAHWANAPASVGSIRFNYSEIDKFPNRRVQMQRQLVPSLIEPCDAALYLFIFGNLPANLSNNSLRTKLISDAGWFDQSFPYAGDFEFWVRAWKRSSAMLVDDFVTCVRRHPHTASVQLNRRGELLPQLFRIVDSLSKDLDSSLSGVKQLHAASCYDASHRYHGVRKLILEHNAEYIRAIDAAATENDVFPSWLVRWAVFFVTLGGRVNQLWTSKWLLSQAGVTHQLEDPVPNKTPDRIAA